MDEIDKIELLEKKLEWLDNERRSDKNNLASFQNKIQELELDNKKLSQKVEDLNNEILRLTTKIAAVDKYETQINHLKNDLNGKITNIDSKNAASIKETEKRLRYEIDSTNKLLSPVLQLPESVQKNKDSINRQSAEDNRLGKLIEELKLRITEIDRFDEDYKRSIHLLQETDRQSSKRITDLQGDLVSQQKRIEENRGRIELSSENFRQYEKRLTELQSYERDRIETQNAFFEKINKDHLEHNQLFKEFKTRFDMTEKISQDLNTELQNLDKLQKNVTKTLTSLDDVSQRFERRINEISEVQRLNDERARQEWQAFKSDDLKRWTGYKIEQEEHLREINKQISSMSENLEKLENARKIWEESLQQSNEDTIQRLEKIISIYRDSLDYLTEVTKNTV